MKRGYSPQRTCLGCGARDDQSALLRLALQGTGELSIDRRGEGRGGYVHKQEGCWEAFLRKKSISRAFRVEIGRAVRERLVLVLREKGW